MIVTLPRDNDFAQALEKAIEQHGFLELRSERTSRVVFLFAPETLDGFTQALTDDRLRLAVRKSVSALREGKGMSIDPAADDLGED